MKEKEDIPTKMISKRKPRDWQADLTVHSSDAEHLYSYSLVRLSSQSYGIVEIDLINWRSDCARLVYVATGMATAADRVATLEKLNTMKEDLNNQSSEDYNFAYSKSQKG